MSADVGIDEEAARIGLLEHVDKPVKMRVGPPELGRGVRVLFRPMWSTIVLRHDVFELIK